MPSYFRFGIGPFRFSQRLGQTQSQKRAAARRRAQAQEQRARQREFNRTRTEVVEYHYTSQGTDSQIAVFGRESPLDHDLYLHLRKVPVTVPEGTWVAITYRSGNLIGIGPAEVPASVVARRAAQADHDARTYRAVIAECRIDGIKGGSFDIVAEGRPTVSMTVQPDLALRFLSLKNGDIVQVTLAKDQAGVEEFRHLSRANGATPRNPANFGRGELMNGPGEQLGWLES